jgi:hypothetical protein
MRCLRLKQASETIYELKLLIGYIIEIKSKGGTMPWYNGDYPPSYKNDDA